MNIKDFKKIILIGCSGSGKSYTARKVADITGYPLVHLDVEFWQPDWVKTPKDEWIKKQLAMISGDAWVIDGNYNSTLEMRYEAADLVIFLDINRRVCMTSALQRHGQKRSDLPDYLDEKFNWEFVQFLKWIWEFPRKGKRKILALHDKYPDKPFLILKSRREVQRQLGVWRNQP